METTFENRFIEEVKKAFSFLQDREFVVTTRYAGTAHILTSVDYLGKNVAVMLAHDHRIQVTDLYVAKVRDGKIISARDGGYMDHFGAYLVKYQKFRSGIRNKKMIPENYKSLPLEEQIKIDLQIYADAIREYGKVILEDSEKAFQ